jgi:hypothetical protein
MRKNTTNIGPLKLVKTLYVVFKYVLNFRHLPETDQPYSNLKSLHNLFRHFTLCKGDID